MTEWYYARNGQQQGPVSFEQLSELARKGGLDPSKDLVWTSTMKDWTPAGQVAALFAAPSPPAAGTPPADPSNPYAAPVSTWDPATQKTSGEVLEEIPPGSQPIDVMACVKRAFTITGRNIGMILLVAIIYFGLSAAMEVFLGWMDTALGMKPAPQEPIPPIPPVEFDGFSDQFAYQQESSGLNLLISNIFSVFLSLGATRIGLNLISGKEVSIGMLFGGGPKLLRAVVATLLYGLMVGLGTLLLIVPGVYLALRFGHFQSAIVDRDMGIMEAFSYSSSITTNNRLNLLVLGLLSILIVLGGCLALVVGLFFAIPVMWLSWLAAYRWMQFGPRALMDQPGTTTPMLANQ